MGFSIGLFYTASFETRSAVSGFHKKENKFRAFSVHQKLRPKHTSSMFPWLMKHHCPPLLVSFCAGSALQIQGLSKEYLTAAESKFEMLQLKHHSKGWSDSMGWGLSDSLFPSVLRWRCWGVILPLWTWALWPYSGFQCKKKGAAEDRLPQITHQSLMATSRVRRGVRALGFTAWQRLEWKLASF